MMITSLIAARATITEDLKDPQSYVRLVRLTQINRYFCLASTIIVWWDWFITLDDEIAYIWRPRKTTMTGKPLYIFLRYCGLAYQTYDLVQNFGAWSVAVFD
ncbi:hypothetical protein FRB94_013845 [Tulasnella sp. JGI-2019a]|nr:hypothetical protein FRB94_013845 [Tulasnella sp. JGI-2019a]